MDNLWQDPQTQLKSYRLLMSILDEEQRNDYKDNGRISQRGLSGLVWQLQPLITSSIHLYYDSNSYGDFVARLCLYPHDHIDPLDQAYAILRFAQTVGGEAYVLSRANVISNSGETTSVRAEAVYLFVHAFCGLQGDFYLRWLAQWQVRVRGFYIGMAEAEADHMIDTLVRDEQREVVRQVGKADITGAIHDARPIFHNR